MATRSAATADNKAAGREEGECSLFGYARRRPIVRRVDNFKTKPRRPAVHCAKITGKQRKRGGGGWVVRLSAGKRHAAGESTLVDAFISRLRNPRSSDSPSTNRPCPRHRGRDSPWKPQKNACRYAYLSDDTPLLPQDTTTFSQTTSSTNQPLFRQLKHRSTDIRSRFLVVVVRGIADIGPKMCPMFIGTYVYTNFLYIYTGVE